MVFIHKLFNYLLKTPPHSKSHSLCVTIFHFKSLTVVVSYFTVRSIITGRKIHGL